MIRGTMVDTLYGASDPGLFDRELDYAQGLGMNMIRFPLYENPGHPLPIDQYKIHVRQFLDFLEAKLPLIQSHGLQVILDLHHPVGGLSGSHWQIFRKSEYRNAFIDFWKEIALRFDNEPIVAAYELLNEPGDRHAKKWNVLAQQTMDTLRNAGVKKTFIIGHVYDDPHNMRYQKFFGPSPTIYAFHLYLPKNVTFDSGNGPGYTKNFDWIHSQINYALKFRDKHACPLICTEFGCSRFSQGENQYRWLRDVLEVFKAEGIGWIYMEVGDNPGNMWTVTLDRHSNGPANVDLNRPAAQLMKGQAL